MKTVIQFHFPLDPPPPSQFLPVAHGKLAVLTTELKAPLGFMEAEPNDGTFKHVQKAVVGRMGTEPS